MSEKPSAPSPYPQYPSIPQPGTYPPPPPYEDWNAPKGPPQPMPHSATNYSQPVTQQIVVESRPLGMLQVGQKSTTVLCSNCNETVHTKTSSSHKCCTHFMCLFMFVTGICTLCSCLPYCCRAPETVRHFCPKCNALVGTYYG